MMKFIFGMQRNSKILIRVNFIILEVPDMPKVPKIGSLHINALSLEKHDG